MNLIAIGNWFNPCLLSLFLRQRKRAGQRHLTSAGRVWALDRSRPDPCNDGGFTAALFMRHFHLGIEMSDTLKRLLFHPFAVIAHILRKALCSVPTITHSRNLCIRIHRSFAGEAGRNFNHSLVDRYSYRIQVVGVCFQPKTLRLERDGTSTGKGVKKRRRIPVCGFHDFRLGCLQHPLIIRILPYNEIFEDLEETLAFFVLVFLCRKFFRMRRRVIYKTRPDDRPCRRPKQ